MDNASARNMWEAYLNSQTESVPLAPPPAVYFCTNEQDANECAQLVRTGVKRATSPSLLGLQYRKERLPKIGDYMIVTDWEGNAQCIVRTTAVQLRPFFSIDEAYARIEGEGDKSLAYWKRTHWDYYTKELEAFGRVPRDSMIIVCQEFEKVF